jgi:2,3-bisphosphoglycerate-dependent phosphoglycerate mutase
MPVLCIVRHGQSQWNLENRFTGEVDVELTDQGREEARNAGKKLRDFVFSRAFCSELRRSTETLEIIQQESARPASLVIRTKFLNERNYGSLQGLGKSEVAEKYGTRQVDLWRRSYAARPPGGESLEDTAARVIPYYTAQIEPWLERHENILIVAHGNSLRALMMRLEAIGPQEIAAVDLPTGVPRIYEMGPDLSMLSIRNL